MSFEAETPLTTLIWSRKRALFATLAVFVTGGVAYQLFAPAVWEAKATIVFPVKSPSLLGATNFGDVSGGLAALAGGPTPLKVYGGILESQRTLNYIAQEIGEKPRDVNDMRKISDQAMESSLTVSARSTDPEKARKVVALHLKALDEINKSLSSPLVGDDAAAVTRQLEKERARLRDAEKKLLAFQKGAQTAPTVMAGGAGKDGSVTPVVAKWADAVQNLKIEQRKLNLAVRTATSKLISIRKRGSSLPLEAPQLSAMRDGLTKSEYELQIALMTFAPDSIEIQKRKEQIAAQKQKLQNELEFYVSGVANGISTSLYSNLPELFLQQASNAAQLTAVERLAKLAPAESIELARLTREVSISGAIVAQLEGQNSLASLQESRNPSRWELLDVPEVDDKPANKSWSKNIALSGLLGLAFGSLIALSLARRGPKSNAAALTADSSIDEFKKAA